MNAIGIRLEDKNEWEARTPLIPAQVRELKEQHGVEVCVQASPIRAFGPEEYEQAGARVVDDLTNCPVVLAVKEIPMELFERGKTYMFFSHTIKGQKDNMPMLQRLLDLDCQLLDYEKIVDENGRRLVFFGNYAGLAGMLDTLWAVGQRLAWEGIRTPLTEIKQARHYADLEAARQAVREAGQRIADHGLPASITPFVCGFAGYGNVSSGAQEIYDLLPVREIAPADLANLGAGDPHCVYKVVFKEQDMVEPIEGGATFQLQDYYDHPEKYRSQFERYLPHLTALVNGIYWTARYPRLVTRQYLKELFSGDDAPRLRVIGDISCDQEGAIECNLRCTTPGDPLYVYDPLTGETTDGHQGRGVVLLAVDNLPCELPRESSSHFSATLAPFVPELAQADYSAPLAESGLSPTVQRAVIAWQGELTPDYRYIEKFL
jgi:alpha-aminoadipic semialdehyde synthase